VSKEPSFLSRHILARYFLAHSDLEELQDAETLRGKKHFGYYKQSRGTLEEKGDEYSDDIKKMDIIEEGFISTSLQTFDKHFARFKKGRLL